MAHPDVWLIRHGETEWSRTGQHTGRTDLPLTERGRGVARQLGQRLTAHHFDLVLTSPLARARETCQLAGFGEQAEARDALMEWDYGEYEGLSTPQIRATRPGWWLWRDGAAGGETLEQVGERADSVIAEVRAQDGDALLFAHGHILRILAARWMGLEAFDGSRLALGTATVSVLGWEREAAVVERWNCL